jgi:hypothetical protein
MRPRKVTVFFRYDDFSALSPFRVDSALALLFRKHRMRCSFAVIPLVTEGNYRDPSPRGWHELDRSRRTLLRTGAADSSIDVVLHGLHHRSNGLGAPHSEFRGLSFEMQLEKLQQGQRLLEEVIARPVMTFVPPWNTYDEATLRAMATCGISCISANRFGSVPGRRGGVSFLPITADILDLKSAIACAQQSGDEEAVVGALLHPYDFLESDDERGRLTLQDMDALLGWLSAQSDVEVSSLSGMLGQTRDLSRSRFAANRPPSVDDIRPPCIPSVAEIPYYMCAVEATRRKQRRTASILATHLGGTTLGALIGWAFRIASQSVPAIAPLIVWAIPCLLILMVLWRALVQGRLYFKSALLLGFSLGWAVTQICLALLDASRD